MSLGHKLHSNFCFEYHQHFININKRNTMEHIRFRAWDTIEKQFFKPVYKRGSVNNAGVYISEILLTQAGEVMYRETKDGETKITHEIAMEFRNRFKINLRAGMKDIDNKKYYFNDIVKVKRDDAGTQGIGVLIWLGNRLGIGFGPIDDYTFTEPITESELKQSEIIGNIYMDRHIIMGIEPPDESNDDKLKNQLKSKGLTD